MSRCPCVPALNFLAKCEIYHKNLPNFVYIEVKLNENWVREMKEKPKNQIFNYFNFSHYRYLKRTWACFCTTGQQFITNHIWNTRKGKTGMEAFHCRILNAFQLLTIFFMLVFFLLRSSSCCVKHNEKKSTYHSPKNTRNRNSNEKQVLNSTAERLT